MGRSFWITWTMLQQENAPEFVEALMMVLFMVLCGIWLFDPREPYLLAGLSLTVGAYSSILVRLSFRFNHQFHPTRLLAAIGLLLSLWGVVSVALSA